VGGGRTFKIASNSYFYSNPLIKDVTRVDVFFSMIKIILFEGPTGGEHLNPSRRSGYLSQAFLVKFGHMNEFVDPLDLFSEDSTKTISCLQFQIFNY